MQISKKLIKSLAEGILNYYIFLTKCGVSNSVSEYTLYEPLFRMLNKHKDMMISCEYPVNYESYGRGDKKIIDFVIQINYEKKLFKGKNKSKKGSKILFAIELKLLKKAGRHYGKNAFNNDKEKLVKLQEIQKTKFGKFIFAIYKTNKDDMPIEGSAENLNVYLNCVDATYRLDVIEI
jgi:hypothetical protein